MNINKKKSRQRRRTRQREALRRVFETSNRPLTPSEACALARRRAPGIGIATAYRAVADWVASGWLARVALPDEAARYERTDLAHHHHFRCDHCARVFDLPGCAKDLRRLVPRGFRARTHQITILGVCGYCAVFADKALRKQVPRADFNTGRNF